MCALGLVALLSVSRAAPAADTALPGRPAPGRPVAAPVVAITFDDLPLAAGVGADAEAVNRAILAALAERRIPATGFVNQARVDQLGADGLAVLRAWTAKGHDLGNHLYSHADVNGLTLEQAEAEIVRGEPAIDKVLAEVGRRPRFLRFPFNHTGDTKAKHDALAAFMAARGYRLAPCTIDNEDYNFNRAYETALARHDAAAAAIIRTDYLAFTAAEIDWYSKLDSEVFGRPTPHVMLLHDSRLNGDMLPDVLALFVARGYRFVTLDEAVKDPAYAAPEVFVTKFGPMWGYRWARELHVRVHGENEPNAPAWIEQYARQGAPR